MKLPILPYGEGSMYMRNNSVSYKKTITLTNGKKIRKVVSGKNPKQCLEKMKEFEESVKNSNANSSRIVLIDGIIKWLENSYKDSVKPQTYRRLLGTANNQIEPSSIGHVCYQEITGDEIQNVLNDLNQNGYSHSTIKKTYDLLGSFFRYASAKDKFDNPMIVVNMPKISNIKAETKTVAWLEEDEIQRFIQACDITYNTGALKFRYGYILAANIYLGMRGGELLAIQWKDIDFEKNTIYVCKTLIETVIDGKTVFTVQQSTKKDKNRYVPINSKAKELLMKHQSISTFTDPDDYVISTANRRTNTLKNLSDAIKAIETEAEIDKPCNTHILRHTCASLYFKKGVPIEVICQILGNSREVCEKTYVHFVEQQLKEAASKIDIIEI